MPSDFVEKVRRWTRLYQTRDRDEMELVLGARHRDFEAVRQQVTSAGLPPDLAFATLVESHFQAGTRSPDDNAGLWQFTRDTARRNGLKVNADIDERLDPSKSTEAACRYLLQLRRQLGPEGSLMLALAAYNMGPGRLTQRMQQVEDLSKRHDFWHLYRTRLLPAITRTHLARLMASILIGRYPQYFGFKTATLRDLKTVSSAVSHF
jgi:membrane-bound lytic murein transglycosylase D